MKIKLVFISILKIYLIPLLGLLLIAYSYPGCNDDDNGVNPPPPPGANTVSIQSSSFNPGNLTVTIGTKVTWTNNDNIAHTVTSGSPGNASGLFDSGNMATGATFEFTFTEAGEFNYFCAVHPGMTARVTVQN